MSRRAGNRAKTSLIPTKDPKKVVGAGPPLSQINSSELSKTNEKSHKEKNEEYLDEYFSKTKKTDAIKEEEDPFGLINDNDDWFSKPPGSSLQSKSRGNDSKQKPPQEFSFEAENDAIPFGKFAPEKMGNNSPNYFSPFSGNKMKETHQNSLSLEGEGPKNLKGGKKHQNLENHVDSMDLIGENSLENEPPRPKTRTNRGSTPLIQKNNSLLESEEPPKKQEMPGSFSIKPEKPKEMGNSPKEIQRDSENQAGLNQNEKGKSKSSEHLGPKTEHILLDSFQLKIAQSDTLFLSQKLQSLLDKVQDLEQWKSEKERLEAELSASRERAKQLEELLQKAMENKEKEYRDQLARFEQEKTMITESLRNQHQEEMKTQKKIAEYEKKMLEEMLNKERDALKAEIEAKSRLSNEINRLSVQISELTQRKAAVINIEGIQAKRDEEDQRENLREAFKRLDRETKMLESERKRLEKLSMDLALEEARVKAEKEKGAEDLRREKDKILKEIERQRKEDFIQMGELFREKAAMELLKKKYEKEQMNLREEAQNKQRELDARSEMLGAMEKGVRELQEQTDEEVKRLKEENDKRRKALDEEEKTIRRRMREVEMAQNEVSRAAENAQAKERTLRSIKEELDNEKNRVSETTERFLTEAERVYSFERHVQAEVENIENEKMRLEIEKSKIENERFRLETEKKSVEETQRVLHHLKEEYLKSFSTQEALRPAPTSAIREYYLEFAESIPNRVPIKSQTQFKPLIRAQTSAGPDFFSELKRIPLKNGLGKTSNLAQDYEKQLKKYQESIRASHNHNEIQKIKTLRGNFF